MKVLVLSEEGEVVYQTGEGGPSGPVESGESSTLEPGALLSIVGAWRFCSTAEAQLSDVLYSPALSLHFRPLPNAPGFTLLLVCSSGEAKQVVDRALDRILHCLGVFAAEENGDRRLRVLDELDRLPSPAFAIPTIPSLDSLRPLLTDEKEIFAYVYAQTDSDTSVGASLVAKPSLRFFELEDVTQECLYCMIMHLLRNADFQTHIACSFTFKRKSLSVSLCLKSMSDSIVLALLKKR